MVTSPIDVPPTVTTYKEFFEAINLSVELNIADEADEGTQDSLADLDALTSLIKQARQAAIQSVYVESFIWGRDELRSFEHMAVSAFEEKIEAVNANNPPIFSIIQASSSEREDTERVLQDLYRNTQIAKTGEYYEWRTKLQNSIKDQLNFHLDLVSKDRDTLEAYARQEQEEVAELEAEFNALAASMEEEDKLSGVLEAIEEQDRIESEFIQQVGELEKKQDQANTHRASLDHQLSGMKKQLEVPIVTSEEVRLCTQATELVMKEYQILSSCLKWRFRCVTTSKLQLYFDHPDQSKTWVNIEKNTVSYTRFEETTKELKVLRRLCPFAHWLFAPPNTHSIASLRDIPNTLQQFEDEVVRKNLLFEEVKKLVLEHHALFEAATQSLVVWFTSPQHTVHFPIKFRFGPVYPYGTPLTASMFERPLHMPSTEIQYGSMTNEKVERVLAQETRGRGVLLRVCKTLQAHVDNTSSL